MSADISWKDYPYRVLGNRSVTPVIRELQLAPDKEVLPYTGPDSMCCWATFAIRCRHVRTR